MMAERTPNGFAVGRARSGQRRYTLGGSGACARWSGAGRPLGLVVYRAQSRGLSGLRIAVIRTVLCTVICTARIIDL